MLMDGNNWWAAQGQGQGQGQVIGDWRTQLPQGSRQTIVNMLMETLKRHLPCSRQEGLQEIMKLAIRYEEEIYTAASSQSDYLRRISLEMLSMETKSENIMGNSHQSNAASNSTNFLDSDSLSQIKSEMDEDWQEETYQKIKSMHEMYYLELNEIYQRVAAMLQQHDARPQQPRNEQLQRLRFTEAMLERMIKFLRTNKTDIWPNHRDKIGRIEKLIVNILNANGQTQAVSSMQPQLSQPHAYGGQINSLMQQMNYHMQQMNYHMHYHMQQMNIQGSSLPTQHNNSNQL